MTTKQRARNEYSSQLSSNDGTLARFPLMDPARPDANHEVISEDIATGRPQRQRRRRDAESVRRLAAAQRGLQAYPRFGRGVPVALSVGVCAREVRTRW